MGKRSFKKAFKVADEWATPSILVKVIVPYLKLWEVGFISKNNRKPIIWLPFDTEESAYYKILKAESFQVVRSHLNDDKDFFLWQPEQFDIAVSNPPFSLKVDVFKRMIFEFNKPFVFLMNMMSINYQNVSELFANVNPDIQFIIPDKKVSFDGNTSSFSSGYVCYKFIDHTIFHHLPHNNTGNNFSR
ncbi:MAG: adenine-specific methyltransferase EcoRI family protein [Treponema sp.]|nr:adenine-specific methyltransferase EcoRI family protein [Treponema sp.]